MDQKGKAGKKARVKKEGDSLGFGRINYILMGVGLILIIIGYVFLALGDITIAPILLVLGYCGVLPTAILIAGHSKKGSRPKTPAEN
jgi:hypothetical protein